MKKENFKKPFQAERELTNENLENVLGGTAASKISVTISMTQANAAEKASQKSDSDSDGPAQLQTMEDK